MTRILALDIGEKRIGVAVSDETRTLASVWGKFDLKWKADPKWYEQLKNLVEELEVATILVGLPLNMNGTEGDQARNARDIGDKIHSLLSIPVEYFDERLSTVTAEATLIEAGLSRKKRKDVRDGLSAQIFLQTYLNSLKGGGL